jgi:hypothetical protein
LASALGWTDHIYLKECLPVALSVSLFISRKEVTADRKNYTIITTEHVGMKKSRISFMSCPDTNQKEE